MSSEQQPALNEKGIVTLIHILGGFFYFIPAVIAYFSIDNLSENSKKSIKIALNYQITVTILSIIVFILAQAAGMLSFLLFPIMGLLWFLFTLIIPLANIVISLIAGLSYYNNGTLKYPPYFEFIK